MGLFDKFKKVAKESMQATGIADVLQKQADDVRLAMKYGVTATPKNLEIAREKEAAERKAKEEAERRAQEEVERKAIEEAKRRKREEAELRAQKEAERKAREEAERKAKEDAALEDVRLEEARLAQIEANRQRQAELDRKEFEDAKRKAQMEAELRAMKEAEEKAQAEAHQQKLAKEQEEKQNVLAPIKDYVEKAENGDGQAACQIGLWFQHGQKGLPQDIEQAKYWYQQAMVLGNQNAATFLNILVGNEQEKVKASQKQEALKAQEEEDNRLRLKYDTEDEFLANEKNDAEAANRIVTSLTDKFGTVSDDPSISELERLIGYCDQCIKYLKIVKIYGKNSDSHMQENVIESIKIQKKRYEDWIEIIKEHKEKRMEALREAERAEREEERERMEAKQKEESMVKVRFDWIRHYNDSEYTSKQYDTKKMPREEYHALIQATPEYLENYVKSNFDSSHYNSYPTNVSMTTV